MTPGRYAVLMVRPGVGSALERALLGVLDSLAAHRVELEATGTTPVAMP